MHPLSLSPLVPLAHQSFDTEKVVLENEKHDFRCQGFRPLFPQLLYSASEIPLPIIELPLPGSSLHRLSQSERLQLNQRRNSTLCHCAVFHIHYMAVQMPFPDPATPSTSGEEIV